MALSKIVSTNIEEIEKTFKLLESGERVFNLTFEEFALVLGISGSGKSSFLQWIAGDDNKLISKQEGIAEYTIDDGNRRIGGSSTQSKTLYPELVIDEATNSAFYDCPGFKDTRDTSHDIAATYFIKKLTDHAEKVKIVLVVDKHHVTTGADRHGFMELLEHVTKFLIDVNKFKGSIALIVSKVDNKTEKKNGSYVLVPDEIVIENIANFLRKIRDEIKTLLGSPKVEADKKIFYLKAIKIIDEMLFEKNGKLARIGIFRKPDEPGPLSEISILYDGKIKSREVVIQNINYVNVDKNDFGYSLSANSLKDVHEIVLRIDQKLWESFEKLTENIKLILNENFHLIYEKINVDVDFLAINPNLENECSSFSKNIKDGLKFLSILIRKIQSGNDPEEIANSVKTQSSLLTNLKIKSLESKVNEINKNAKYFSFLKQFTEKELRLWDIFFLNSKENLIVLQKDFNEKIAQIRKDSLNRMQQRIAEAGEILEKSLSLKLDKLNFKNLPSELDEKSSSLKKFLNDLQASESIVEKSITIENYFNVMKVDSTTNNVLSKMKFYSNIVEFLRKFNGETIQLNYQSINDNLIFNEKNKAWLHFLKDVYVKLSNYEIQNKRQENFDAINFIPWTKENFSKFCRKIDIYYQKFAFESINKEQFELLNHIIKISFKATETSCLNNNERLLVKGINVKFSDFITEDHKLKINCGSSMKSIDIFALNSVFIDKSLNHVGQVQMNVIAPKWHIEHTTIYLQGKTGEEIFPKKAKGGCYFGQKGTDGMPGNPGGPGGNFFGFGEEFKNFKNLEIIVYGGRGGKGQDGGDGADANGGESSKGGNGGDGGSQGTDGNTGSIELYSFPKTPYSFDIKFDKSPSNPDYYDKDTYKGEGGLPGEGGFPDDRKLFDLDDNNDRDKWRHDDLKGKRGGRGTYSVGKERSKIVFPMENMNDVLNRYQLFLYDEEFRTKDFLSFNETIQSFLKAKNDGYIANHSSSKKYKRETRSKDLQEFDEVATSSAGSRPIPIIGNFVNGIKILPEILFNPIAIDKQKSNVHNVPKPFSVNEITADFIQSGALLLDLILRKFTNKKYLQNSIEIATPQANKCIEAIEFVETMKRASDAKFDEYEMYESIMMKK